MRINTKESIADTIEGLEMLVNRGIQSVHIDMAIAGMRRLLASLEAEPVAWLYSASFERGHVEGELTDAPGCDMPVYTTPPAPVSVPDEATPENIEILAITFAPRGVTYQWDRDECNAAADSWNACRAAMLNQEKNNG